MAVTLMLAFLCWQRGSILNNGPTANKRGMLDAWGSLEATVDGLLRQRFQEWGVTGCASKTLADEPSYWLRRLLAPWEHKWRAGVHLGPPPVLTKTCSVPRVLVLETLVPLMAIQVAAMQ